MKVSLYAKFQDAAQAERALAALVDHGADVADMTALFPEGYQKSDSNKTAAEQAVSGVTTTTGGDAAVGAGKGAAIGLGVGALAALTSLFIPGFGLVTGGSALVTALAGLAGATAGGAVAGGVAGYLQDQGVPARIALDAEEALKNGRAVLGIDTPTGKLGEFEVLEIVSKYHAESFGRTGPVVQEAPDQIS
jgi:hypothetical protein